MRYTEEQQAAAIEHYIANRLSLRAAVKALGYPSYETLHRWLNNRGIDVGLWSEHQLQSFRIDNARTKAACMVAKRKALALAANKSVDTSGNDELLRLRKENAELKQRNVDLEMETAILKETIKIIKKDPGVDSMSLSNKEKTIVIGALRKSYQVEALRKRMNMSKSSYYYQVVALTAPKKYERVTKRICELFSANRQVYGYRRIHALLHSEGIRISEKTVRSILVEEGLKVKCKKTKRFSSYAGEITPAPENLLERNFFASAPNEKWLTDITEFKIASGRVYLSPIIDCFDGKVVAWTAGVSPNAEMANRMLTKALGTLAAGEKPVVHSDRGSHYRWSGWIELMENSGLTRSMSKKGCSPDNSACEGFFGRLKNEFYYGRNWDDYSVESFINALDEYISWYNDVRIKKSLGWMSPAQYRNSLNLAA